MKDFIFLLVRCIVETDHRNIHKAIAEFQEQKLLQVASTPNVRVRQAEIIKNEHQRQERRRQ